MIRTYAETAHGTNDLRIFGSLYRRARPRLPSASRSRQSLGIGAALLERSLLAARSRGVKLLHVCCLVENQRMQQLARTFEATSLSISAR